MDAAAAATNLARVTMSLPATVFPAVPLAATGRRDPDIAVIGSMILVAVVIGGHVLWLG
jgi:hypothetical protein